MSMSSFMDSVITHTPISKLKYEGFHSSYVCNFEEKVIVTSLYYTSMAQIAVRQTNGPIVQPHCLNYPLISRNF